MENVLRMVGRDGGGRFLILYSCVLVGNIGEDECDDSHDPYFRNDHSWCIKMVMQFSFIFRAVFTIFRFNSDEAE